MPTSKFLGWPLAVIACATVANLYYSQPILASMAASLHTTTRIAAGVVVATLIGNGLAQLLVVPLADLVERRGLVQVLLVVQAAGMALVAAARHPTMAVAASVLVGLGGAAGLVLLPYAAALANPEQRGRSTGMIMSGVLVGILFSRSISGAVSEVLSWRLTYAVGALIAVTAAVTMSRFPRSRTESPASSYAGLLRDVLGIAATNPTVQRRMVIGALGFVSFNLLWTGLTLLLAQPPFLFGDAVIGLFGLVGLVGALVARNAGTWYDQGHGRSVAITGWVLTGLAWTVSLASGHSGWVGASAILTAVVLLDAGMQAQHVTNQSSIIAGRPHDSARAITAYMTSCVLAGAVGSALAPVVFQYARWSGVAVTGLGCTVLALIVLCARVGFWSGSAGDGLSEPRRPSSPGPGNHGDCPRRRRRRLYEP